MNLEKMEKIYTKTWDKKQRPLDMAYVNFIIYNFKRGKILDMGCGFGELIGVLREFVFEVYGTVATKYETDECKRKGLNVIQHDASKKFPYEKAYFDHVISIGSIEHIQNWNNALKEMHRVLKKNGNTLIETPNHSVFRKSEKYKMNKDHLNIVHIKEFDYSELITELKKKGFQDIKAHNKRAYYPNYFACRKLDILPKHKLPYLFFSAKK